MPLTKELDIEWGKKSVGSTEKREESQREKRRGGDKERLKLSELSARSAYSFGILLKSRLLFRPK